MPETCWKQQKTKEEGYNTTATFVHYRTYDQPFIGYAHFVPGFYEAFIVDFETLCDIKCE